MAKDSRHFLNPSGTKIAHGRMSIGASPLPHDAAREKQKKCSEANGAKRSERNGMLLIILGASTCSKAVECERLCSTKPTTKSGCVGGRYSRFSAVRAHTQPNLSFLLLLGVVLFRIGASSLLRISLWGV